ncbi:MAG: serine/threonine protein kinase, partial [Myxococcales bacterium]|nr:serine/threonine protein kinase [Myxococcales bacterium]
MIEVGQTVGNYTIVSKLGEGGMGTVYLAEHPVIGRKAALKAIHPHFARDADIVSRFVTEAKSVNQIGHQNIVDVTDFGTTPDGDFYFIMEYLPGDNLAEVIGRAGRLAPERALRIAVQIADALEACHGHGVIHRDLKPENVILIARNDDVDFVKVLDFGLAKLTVAADAPTHTTRAGAVMGTPYYMAPEQCEGRAEIDHRADIYALGVILFEMLTGKIPFGGTGFGEIILKHMSTPPPAARSIVPELSPALDLILFRALEKDPRERFQTMSELREALLDPDSFASAVPTSALADDLSMRVRAARPMARFEMMATPALPSSLPPPIRESAPPSARSASPPAASTFERGAGQLDDGADLGELRPKRARGRGVVLSVLALAALALVGAKFRRQAGRMVVTALSPKQPTTIRVNFSSDPDGARVTSADGTVLGVTPLSTDVPFGNVGLTYVLSKKGYLPKTLASVPNLAAPLFAVLVRDPRAEVVVAPELVPAANAEGAAEPPAESELATPEPIARHPSPAWQAVRALRHRTRAFNRVVDDEAIDDSM